MSVSSILASPAGRAFFKGKVKVPPTPALEVVIEPISEHPQRIGTAFDYALRAGLAGREWAPMGKTIAEIALAKRRDVLAGGLLGRAKEVVARAGALVRFTPAEVLVGTTLQEVGWFLESAARSDS